MKYQIVKIEKGRQEIAPDGSGLSMSEAETLLKEIHLMEMCQVCAKVTPIVTLWFSTKLGAFAVNLKNRHYEYKIMVDHFAELGNMFNPNKVFYPTYQQN